MELQHLSISGIPAVLWGPESNGLFIAIHGDQSNKSDKVITIFAEEAVAKGYQALSFDLPEHGERKGGQRLCDARNCVEDITTVMDYARSAYCSIGLFGCSIGAYFSMLACAHESIRQSLFLSPVVDMKRIIENMMKWFQVSPQQLKREQKIATPVKTLYWDYYQYTVDNPVKWNKPTAVLYGKRDELCELEYVMRFVEETHAHLTVIEDGEHFFHTDAQLSFFRGWLRSYIN